LLKCKDGSRTPIRATRSPNFKITPVKRARSSSFGQKREASSPSVNDNCYFFVLLIRSNKNKLKNHFMILYKEEEMQKRLRIHIEPLKEIDREIVHLF